MLRVLVALAAVALMFRPSPTHAQSAEFDVDLASLGLRVTELRTTDSLVTARHVLRPRAGQKLVLATLVGSTERTLTLLSTPGLLAAHYDQALVPARAFAIVTPGQSRTNWIAASTPDTPGLPQLYAVVRPGPVTVLAIFEVPQQIAQMSVTVPQVRPGFSTIQGAGETR